MDLGFVRALLALLCLQVVFSEKTTLRGQIIDDNESVDLRGYCIRVHWPDITVPAASKSNGYFVVRSSSYKSVMVGPVDITAHKALFCLEEETHGEQIFVSLMESQSQNLLSCPAEPITLKEFLYNTSEKDNTVVVNVKLLPRIKCKYSTAYLQE